MPGRLRSGRDCEALLKAAWAKAGPVNVLINNAAVFHRHGLLEATEARLLDEWRINALAPILLTRAFARRLLSHVCARQTWGVAEIARPRWTVFFKSGWFGAAADPFAAARRIAGSLLHRGRPFEVDELV